MLSDHCDISISDGDWNSTVQEMLECCKELIAPVPVPEPAPASASLPNFGHGQGRRRHSLSSLASSSVESLAASTISCETDENDDKDADSSEPQAHVAHVSRADLEIEMERLKHQHAWLLEVIHQKDERNKHLAQCNKANWQKANRLEKLNNKLQEENDALKKPGECDITRTHTVTDSKRWSWLTPRGAVNLAVRRNLSNISCHDLGFVILDDASHQTVARQEIKAGAAFIANARLFFSRMQHDLFSVKSLGGFYVSFVALRQDATNGKQKVAAAEVEAAYLDDVQEYEMSGVTWENYNRICRVSDVLPIKDESGPGALGFTLKACKSLGCPTFETFKIEPYNNVANSIDHVHWQMMTTDDGSNEKYARKLSLVLAEELTNFINLDTNCAEHQAHLMVLQGLALCDSMLKNHRDWKYFTILAIFAHLVRDLAKDIFVVWTQIFGALSAIACVKRLFPRPDSGRWGCVHELERRIIIAEVDKLYTTITHALESKMNVKSAKRAAAPPASNSMAVNTLALEQMKEHTEKMGKYRAYIVKHMDDKLLARIIEVSNRARSPIIHISNFVKTLLDDETVAKYGNHLTQLVNFKAEEIRDELMDLLHQHTYWKRALDGSLKRVA